MPHPTDSLPSPVRVFVSYRASSDRPLLEALQQAPPIAGLELVSMPYDGSRTDPWEPVFHGLLETSDALVWLVGSNTAMGRNVRLEIEAAAENEMPVVYAGPGAARLPEADRRYATAIVDNVTPESLLLLVRAAKCQPHRTR